MVASRAKQSGFDGLEFHAGHRNESEGQFP